jgi:hypothetical protein
MVKVDAIDQPLFYGGRCEKYETDDRKKVAYNIPNLFRKRLEMLREGYTEIEPCYQLILH